MAFINRDKDVSEKNFIQSVNIKSTVTGKNDNVFNAPAPVSAIKAQIIAVGLSGAPTATISLRRFVAGAGETFIPLGAALTLQAVSTSGPQSYTFSTTAIQANDTLCVQHGASNAAAEQVMVSIVMQAAQDYRSWTFS